LKFDKPQRRTKMKMLALITILLFSGTALAQNAAQQSEWGQLTVLASCEVDTEDHFHLHGFSHDGTNKLIAHYKTSNAELDAETFRGYAKVCSSSDKSAKKIAALVQEMQDAAVKLRGEQIDKIKTLLNAADQATWEAFKNDTPTVVRETDAAQMIRDGTLSAELVIQLSCDAPRGTP
jgi:hypothetical protein